ncbi:hypothetical protein [Aeromonas hydrophila]|uniref:hypothetical protein n=1 Tax=Aeromonas hydrophila TaxID=644 RepID=UPI002366F91C|nr:hypothetical protein [Aeromonas hydrophila]WDF91714.1 hypothetical protein PUB83_05445 [Aeromonas hydrophila subsp. hydrophila]
MIAVLATIFIASLQPANSASVPDGETIVRIDDGTSTRCINSSSDRITMNLRRLVVKKDVGFFSEDKTAGVFINTIISGNDSSGDSRKVGFPRVYTVTVIQYASGIVSLPVEEKLFSRFYLSNNGNTYDTAELEFSVVSKKDKTPLGIALVALEDISRNLPVPINPFSEGFKYFTQYANKVVNESLNSANNVSEMSKEGKIVMNFSSTGICTGDQEQTGTIAVVKGDHGKESDGYVDINKTYCWAAELKPIFNLKYAVPNGKKCNEISSDSFKKIANQYVAFYLSAEPKELISSKGILSRIDNFPIQEFQGKTRIFLPDNSVSELKILDSPRIKLMQEEKIPVQEADFSVTKTELKSALVNSYKKRSLTKPTNIADLIDNSISNRAAFKVMNVRPDQNNAVVKWKTTAEESAAFDISESLRRCEAHGIPIDSCL